MFLRSSFFQFLLFRYSVSVNRGLTNPRGCRKRRKMLYFMMHDFREFNDLRMSRRDTRRCKSLVPVCRNGNSFKWK